MSEYRVMPNDLKGGGVIRFMAEAEGYVMVRRPNCLPFLITKKNGIGANRWSGENDGQKSC